MPVFICAREYKWKRLRAHAPHQALTSARWWFTGMRFLWLKLQDENVFSSCGYVSCTLHVRLGIHHGPPLRAGNWLLLGAEVRPQNSMLS